MAHIGDQPEVLAGVITSLGGSVIQGTDNFAFEIPRAEVKTILPKLGELGIRCERLNEYVDINPRNGKSQTVMVLEARKRL